jgi:hypothetical protein
MRKHPQSEIRVSAFTRSTDQRGRKFMWNKLIISFVALVLIPQLGSAQEPKAVLNGVAKAMGDVKSLQYTGSGANFAFGQNVSPTAP